MRRELWLDGMDLSYEWEKKRVKNMNLRVRPDGSIRVSTAGWVAPQAVDEFVARHADMISEARRRRQETRPRGSITAENGAVLPCMGRETTLVLQEGHPAADAAHPANDQPVGELPDRHGGHHDERAAAARPAGMHRLHYGA